MLDIHLKQANFWVKKFYRRTTHLFGNYLYLNPDQDLHRSIMVAGAARSGTVWLADMIGSQIPCRILFEPFHPKFVPEYGEFHYFQYMRPGTENEKLYRFAGQVLSGNIRNRWIDHQNERIFPKYRLIKEIRANLLLKWLQEKFPAVPIIFLVRHPCAVVLSRMQLGWATDSDIQPFLTQPDLIEDHLGPYLDVIHNAKTDEEKHAVIWSVSNLIPLRQFLPGKLKTVYYENLCTETEVELSSIFKTIGHPYQKGGLEKIANRPSQTSQETSAAVLGINKVESWGQKLSRRQIDSILHIVDAFGLSHLYGDSSLPLNN